MRIQDTELEYTEADAISLDFFLGSFVESKEDWAKRVWNNCRLHAEGQPLPRVYRKKENQTWQERAKELWENKKRKRREKLCQIFDSRNNMSDEAIIQIKNKPEYKTADKRYQEELERINNLLV